MRRRLGVGLAALLAAAAGCADASRDPREGRRRKPTYDKTTGKLTQLTYDRNDNGVIDTWTDMDGAKPLRSRIDQDEDGTIDRWEYYDGPGKLLKVGFSRNNDGKPDAWAFLAARTARSTRVEISSTGDEPGSIAASSTPAASLARVEQDTNGDGRVDKWETYENGALKTAEFDEDGDGRPDRRLTYARQRARQLIESAAGRGRALSEEGGRCTVSDRPLAHLRRRPSRPRRVGDPPAARRKTPHLEMSDRDAGAARPPRPGGGELLVQGQPARLRLPRGRHRRRDSRQLHAPGRVHLRQHADSRDGGARRARLRREEAALPGQLLHLPARLRRSRWRRSSC